MKDTINVDFNLNSNTIVPIINDLNEFFNQNRQKNIILNFSNTRFVKPGGLTPLLAYLIEKKNIIDDYLITIKANSSSLVNLYISRMGFYPLLGIEDTYPYHRKRSMGRFVEPYIFSKDTNPNEVTKKSSDIINMFTKNKSLENYNQALGWCITEIIDNAQDRSESNTNVVMAQKYNNGITEFCVADRGVGIKETMGDVDISSALRRCITREKGHNSNGRGNGLFYTTELIKQDNSNLCSLTIWSEDHMLILYSGSNPIVKKVDGYWQGVNISLSMYNGISSRLSQLMSSIDNYEYSFSTKYMEENGLSLYDN